MCLISIALHQLTSSFGASLEDRRKATDRRHEWVVSTVLIDHAIMTPASTVFTNNHFNTESHSSHKVIRILFYHALGKALKRFLGLEHSLLVLEKLHSPIPIVLTYCKVRLAVLMCYKVSVLMFLKFLLGTCHWAVRFQALLSVWSVICSAILEKVRSGCLEQLNRGNARKRARSTPLRSVLQ